MCGIVGLFGESDPDLLRRMLSCIEHRGPDGEGLHTSTSPELAMGARRLSIVDIEGGDQPISNEDGTVTVVFNGEIYNHESLRAELQEAGHRFETRCDTEVLVHLWEEYGSELPTRLEGMFAFSIWDSEAETLFLARDRMGIKPLFYSTTGDSFRWASELGALLLAEPEPTVDERALYNFFSLKYTPNPQTMVKGIRKLPPGCSLMLSTADGDVTPERYWELSPVAVPDGRQALQREIRRRLERSVRARLMGDVPVGAFLSGGLDSSAVVGLMTELYDQEVRTYSMGFENSTFDESAEARYVADQFGTKHTELTVDLESFDLFGELVRHFGEPIADPAVLPTMLLSERAGADVKTILTGEGADELFAGYGYYRRWPRRRAIADAVPGPVYDLARVLAPHLPSGYDQYVSALHSDEDLVLYLGRQFDADPATYLDTGQDATTSGLRDIIAEAADHADGNPQRLTRFDLRYWLPDDLLYKVDHATMRASLEARVPFLSTGLVELLYSVDHDRKVAGGEYKPLLGGAVADVVPKRIRKRDKQGFNLPIGEWFRQNTTIVQRWLSREVIDQTPYLSSDRVFDIHEDHRQGADRGQLLWKLLTYVAWYHEILEPATKD